MPTTTRPPVRSATTHDAPPVAPEASENRPGSGSPLPASPGVLSRAGRLLADGVSAMDPRALAGRFAGRVPSIAVDERREEGAVVFEAELPGFATEDISVAVQDGGVIVRAERTGKGGSPASGVLRRRERRYGTFSRELALPDGADPASVTALYADGLLVIRVPVPPEPAAPKASVDVPVRHG